MVVYAIRVAWPDVTVSALKCQNVLEAVVRPSSHGSLDLTRATMYGMIARYDSSFEAALEPFQVPVSSKSSFATPVLSLLTEGPW